MFEQSLLETSTSTHGRTRWTVLLTYLLEALVLIGVLAFPLLRTEALPLNEHPIVRPPTRYVRPHVEIVPTPMQRNPARPMPLRVFQQPSRIPGHIDRIPDPPTPPQIGVATDGLPDGAIPVLDLRDQNQVLQSMLRPPSLPAVPHPKLVPRSSKAEESLLLRQIKPIYPAMAIQTRTQGSVVLQAVIARDGCIQHLEVLRGHPLLVNAAVGAVKQWRYRPFLLDGEPVEVETQITVNFTLSGN